MNAHPPRDTYPIVCESSWKRGGLEGRKPSFKKVPPLQNIPYSNILGGGALLIKKGSPPQNPFPPKSPLSKYLSEGWLIVQEKSMIVQHGGIDKGAKMRYNVDW